MSQQPMNLRRASHVVRRYKILVSGAMIVGLIGGVGYAVLNPAKLSSSALVILTVARPNIATDLLIATSQPVLSGALPAIGPGTSLSVLSTEVSATEVTPSAISITAQDASAAGAEKTANAVANNYASYIGSSSSPVGRVQAKVLVPATSATGSGLVKNLAIDGIVGLVAGLLIGFVVALRRDRGDRRLRARDEIASSVGVSVIAAVPVEVPTDVGGWLKLLDTYEPGPVPAWRLRSVLERLGVMDRESNGQGGFSLTVFSLASDRKAIALGPHLAAIAASLGIPTAFVVSAVQEAEVTAALRGACATPDAPLHGGKLLLAVDNGSGLDSRVMRAQLTVVVAVVDEESKQLPDLARTTAALLGVSAGSVTGEQLARAAAVAADSGSSIAGIIVADPDPEDKTTGLVPRPARMARQNLPTKHENVREVRSGDRTRPADWATRGGR